MEATTIDIIFQIIILVMSVVIHEVSHGYVAGILGDPTARLAGRLTLNPIKHLDWFGSFLVPLLTSLVGFTFGWAKPVPVNPYNLRGGQKGEAIVAAAGPLSNLLIALLFGLVIRFGLQENFLSPAFFHIATLIVFINIILCVFNLMPAPPLDGSRILFSFLSGRLARLRMWMEQNGLILLIIFIFFLWQFFQPLVNLLFSLITGVAIS